MPGYRFRLGSFSSHSSRSSNQESLTGSKSSNAKYDIKLAVLGKTGVGKTAILHRFLYDQFPEKHKETIDEVYLNELELVKGVETRLTLDILDMGGSNEFPAMKRIGISNSNAFILVYSIDDADSFEEVRRLRELIYEIKLEKHLAKYSNCTTAAATNKETTIKTDTSAKQEQQPPTNSKPNSFNNNNKPIQQTNSINPTRAIRQQPAAIKLTEQRRHSLNNQMNGHINLNGRIGNHLNQLNGWLNGTLLNGKLNSLNDKLNSLNNYSFGDHQFNQLNNQLNNQFNQITSDQKTNETNQTKRRHHHHKHPENKKSNTKPYVLTNINQRYKLSENLKMISERRKSLTNTTKIGELKSKLDNISENLTDLNDLSDLSQPNTQSTTADILCLRPNSTNSYNITNKALQSISLPLQQQQNTSRFGEKQTNEDILEEEENMKRGCSRGRRRSSFLLSPDSCSSCSDSESDSKSSHCESNCSSKSSSCTSLNELNFKLEHKQQDKENKQATINQQQDDLNHFELETNASFEHINNLNNYKSKLESKKRQESLLSNEDMPPFESPVIVVVGNKCDLECKREVQRSLAENIVQIDWDNGFIECSAKNNHNMTDIFKEMLKQSKLPFVVSSALDSQKNRRRSLPAYPSNGLPQLKELREPNFRTKRNSCALS